MLKLSLFEKYLFVAKKSTSFWRPPVRNCQNSGALTCSERFEWSGGQKQCKGLMLEIDFSNRCTFALPQSAYVVWKGDLICIKIEIDDLIHIVICVLAETL